MRIAGPYAGWVTMTVWRRKSTLLFLACTIILLILCLQYSSSPTLRKININDIDPIQDGSMQEKRSLLGGSSVKFVMSPPPPVSDPPQPQQDQRFAEVPSDEDLIGIKRMGSDNGGIEVGSSNKSPYIPKYRLIHLDLKGAPPKVNYLKKVLHMSSQMGATGVLMEWEDMFPWSGHLAPLSASNAYSREDIKDIISTAKMYDLEVIPLVQTFGHVEFALKLNNFAHLREVPESAQALCPSLNASLDFVQTLIDQVMEMHTDAKFLHIGCDEVFQMGECARCRVQPRENLFLNHVARVAGYVKNKYPWVKPIIWDDMLRHLTSSNLEQYRLGELVEPMVWVYAEDIYRFVPYSVWDKYGAVFPRIWAASAFKGAFGESLYIPNVKRHLENNIRWLEVMNNEAMKFKEGFQGLVITGWQRYDHFSVLCELLPAAIPSLAISLTAVTHGFMNASLRSTLNNYLSCGVFGPSSFFNLNTDPFLWDSYSRCAFPGHAFFKLTYRLNGAEKEANEIIHSIRQEKGWMTDYNVRRNFSTPLRVDELMQEQPRVYHSMTSLARSVKDSLSDIFDDFTIGEWVEQRIYPFILKLEKIQRDSVALKNRKYWPRRPFPILRDFQRFGISVTEESTKEVIRPG